MQSPEQFACTVIREWARGRLTGDDGTPDDPNEAFIIHLAAALTAYGDARAAEERERCARVIQTVFGVSSFAIARALVEQVPISD